MLVNNLAGEEVGPMKKGLIVIAGLMSFFVALAGSADQAEETADPVVETVDCISLNWLDRTDIIDDRNVLFYMRGDQIYLNQLPHRCSGLRVADKFSYRPTINRLCSIDTITPLRDSGPGGLGMTGGIACKLGPFKSITEDDVLVLKEEDVPDPEVDGEPAEIEPIEEDAKEEPIEIESVE